MSAETEKILDRYDDLFIGRLQRDLSFEETEEYWALRAEILRRMGEK